MKTSLRDGTNSKTDVDKKLLQQIKDWIHGKVGRDYIEKIRKKRKKIVNEDSTTERGCTHQT